MEVEPVGQADPLEVGYEGEGGAGWEATCQDRSTCWMEALSPESGKNMGRASSGVGKTLGLVLGLLILRRPLDKQMEMSGQDQTHWSGIQEGSPG